MQSEWPIIPVAGCCDLIVDCVNKTAPIAEAATPFRMIRTTNVRNGFIDLADCKFVDEDTFRIWTRRAKVLDGDVILTREAPIGEVGLVRGNQNIFLGQRLMQYRANRSLLDPRFLCYAFLSPQLQHQFGAHEGSGSVVSHIRVGDCSKFKVPLPPLPVQREIAELLGSIDERVLILRQTNATLESIAQALFKSWFIDFDPVRAKAEGREPEGMDAATAALFPAEFEESALVSIPKGWAVRSLDSLATYLNGLALQKYPPESEEEFLPVIKIAQLRAGHTSGSDKASAKLKPEYLVRDGDVLFSWSGSLEVEFWCGGDGALNQHLFKVTSKEAPKWFYYLATKHFLPGFRDIAAHKATTMGHIQRRHLSEARLPVPPEPVLQALSSVVAPLLERRVNGALQARDLAALRDNLLPRLISGRLRLPEARAEVAAMAA